MLTSIIASSVVTGVITSSIVTGLILFVVRERYRTHLTMLVRKVDRLEEYRSKDYDQTFESIRTIWIALAQLDDYLRFDFPTELSAGEINKERIRPHFLQIRESTALLPDDLYRSTEKALNDIGSSWETFVRTLISLTKQRDDNPDDNGALLDLANNKKQEMHSEVGVVLQNLRNEYRSYIVEYHQA